MAKVFPDNIKQPFESLPLGILQWEISDAVENMIGKDNPKYGIQVSLTAIAPEEAVGVTHTENFVFGREDDPGDLQNGVSAETFEASAGRFDQFCQKAGDQGVDIRGQAIDQVCATLKGLQIKSNNEAKKEPQFVAWGKKKGEVNPYAGRYRVNPRWLALEEGGDPRITGTVSDLEAADQAAGVGAPGLPPAAPPVQRAAAPMPPAQRTAAPAPAAPPRATAPAARRVGGR